MDQNTWNIFVFTLCMNFINKILLLTYSRNQKTSVFSLLSELLFNDGAFLCLAVDSFHLCLVVDRLFPLVAKADTVDEVDG